MMTALGRRIAITAAALALAAAASAQDAPTPPGPPPPLRWDINGSAGLIVGSFRDLGSEVPWTYDSLALAADVGRYWTRHLKTEVGVAVMTTESGSVFDTVPGEEHASVKRTPRPASMSAAATWQFRENVFAHPYVSGGVRLGSWSEQRTDFRADPSGAFLPEARSSRTSLLIRPFVAAGFKSYFNRRLFMRTEALTAFGPHGFSHAIVRVGFGTDF